MASSSGKWLISKELTLEILSRMRVKSLMRFRCVCKFWNYLVRDSTFINKHLRHPKNISRLLVQHHNYNTEKYVFGLFCDKTLSSMPYTYHDIIDLQMPSAPLAVTGPIDGIFCLFHRWEARMALWNPATKEFRSLPLPDPDFPPHFSPFFHNFGCGLDPMTKDYKVIWMRYYWDDEKDEIYFPRVISVYTLRTDSWRLFEYEMTESGCIYNSLCNTFVNGLYYWLARNDFETYTLVAFDMHTEKFKDQIPAPTNISKALLGYIAAYNDRVAMMLYDASYELVERYFYTWVMEEEGYWTKHLAIGPLLEINRPIAIWKNGDLFLESNTAHLVLYDHITDEIKTLGPRGNDCCLEIYLYKESLVSVEGGNECKEEDNMSYLDRVQEFFHEECQTTEES